MVSVGPWKLMREGLQWVVGLCWGTSGLLRGGWVPLQWEEGGVTPPKHPAVWGGEDRGRPRCGCSGPAFLALPAQLLATLLIQYERLRGVQSSGVLIIFWFLCVVSAIVPFRSKILAATAKVRGEREKPARGTPVRGMASGLKVPAGSQAAPPLLSGPPLAFSPLRVVPYLPHLYRERGPM